jgi:ABC-2 type transport system ATP-binding protein
MNTVKDQPIIEVIGLQKRFKRNTILENINFKLASQTIIGICGANGSGKSVFLRIISGLILPDKGAVTVFGERIGIDAEFPRSTGLLIDNPGFLLAMSGKRNLQLLAKVSGNASEEMIEEAIRKVGLDPHDTKPVGVYSTGMRQRLGIAQALMENPDLLILDEPINGLDFSGQDMVHDLLKELRDQGKTIMITSHSRDELMKVCDQAFLMAEGKLEPFNL